MFNNTFFFFTPAANKYILSRAIPSLQKITTLNKLGSESFRLMSNAIIYFIHNDEVNEAIKYIKHLNEVELPSDYIYEKVILKIFNNLPGFLLKEEKSIIEINKCIEFLNFIDASPLDRMFNDLFDDLKTKYY